MKFNVILKSGIFLTLLNLCSLFSAAQQVTQTLRGQVIDADAKTPLIGASVVLANTDPLLGNSTDANGNFRISGVPVGRYTLWVSFLGYESRELPNVLIGAGKEVVLTLELTESSIQLREFVINIEEDKARSTNDMATISARGFTVEETKRYAGSFDDPARMASAFAGVSGDAVGNNDIIIRGNSPRGMLWRLEDIEIPNPNHFANEGASGGAISILNSNMLANSDFYTGAFPAEFGNAYSGVFDIKMRKGNNEKREYAFQASVLGTDASIEGPFIKGKSSSYLVNYRYSTLALLTAAGIEVAGDAIPKYQDASFKLFFPTKKAGNFSFFGLGGLSNIHQEYKNEEDNDKVYEKYDYKAGMGAVGLKHVILPDNKSFIETTLSLTGTKNQYNAYMNDKGQGSFYLDDLDEFYYYAARANLIYNRKLNAKLSARSGLIYSRLFYDLEAREYRRESGRMEEELAEEGNAGLIQAFSSWKFHFSSSLTLNAGLHYAWFELNKNYSVEPRVGLRWKATPKHEFSTAFGIHSRVDPISTYLIRVNENGQMAQPNRNLEMAKARHYVAGWDYYISNNLHLNVEAYYQELYDVPVENNQESTFSTLNLWSGYIEEGLVNTGTGTNYGVEITLERFFANNYYFMITNSLYDSKYVAPDGRERNTAFNGNYVSNILAGKEFQVGKNGKLKYFTISGKGTVSGGQRYTPVDLAASVEQGSEVLDDKHAFTIQADDFLRFDLQLSLRSEKKKSTRTLKIDIQNITNNLNTLNVYYDKHTQKVKEVNSVGLLPVLSYKIEF